MYDTDRGNKICKAFEALKRERSSFNTTLDDITHYILPEFENDSPRRKSLDGTPVRPQNNIATDSALLLGSNLFSHTYDSGSVNFMLRSIEYADDDRVQAWMQDATDKAHLYLNNSNFAEVYSELCLLLPTYGTGVVSCEFDDKARELVFKSHPIVSDFYITLDSMGRVNGVVRQLEYTAAQAKEVFGEENLSDCIKEVLKDAGRLNEKFKFVNMVSENPNYDPEKFAPEYKKYRSEWVDKKDKKIIDIDEGFDSFPYAVPRWMVTRGWKYGYGAGATSLRAIIEINNWERLMRDGFLMAAYPPVFVPDTDYYEIDEIVPNSVIPIDMMAGKPVQYNVNPNIQAIAARISYLENEIQRNFFTNVFMAVSDNQAGRKTATEIDALTGEKLDNIQGMISRMKSEFWKPMIERIITILVEKGELEPLPEELTGEGYQIVYTSRLDARYERIKMQESLAAIQEAASIMAVEQQVPNMKYVMDARIAAKKLLEARNVDFDIIVDDAQYEEILQAEMQAQQEQAAAQEAMMAQQAMVDSMKPIDPMKAPEEGSPLKQLQNGGL